MWKIRDSILISILTVPLLCAVCLASNGSKTYEINDTIYQHKGWLIFLAVSFVMVLVAMLFVIASNRKLVVIRKKLSDKRQLLRAEIAQHKLSEQQLKIEKERSDLIRRVVPSAIFTVDNDRIITSWNDKAASITGYNADEMIGQHCSKFSLEPCMENCGLLHKNIKYPLLNKECWIRAMDGKSIIVSKNVDYLKDDKGNIVGGIECFEDVTADKQAKDELKALNDALAKRGNALEKSRETAIKLKEQAETTAMKLKEVQSQIIQNEKLASIGQLAAGVAHEINNPLGFISSNFETLGTYIAKFQELVGMYSELAEEVENASKEKLLGAVGEIEKLREDLQLDFITEDIQDLFGDVKDGIERITKIVQSLRDFSRIDQQGDFAEYDINDGIKSTLIVAKNEIKYHIKVETELGSLPTILCNSGQLNQVFLNIIINAAQAIISDEKRDDGMISIKTYANDKEVLCEIDDNGPGIPPEKVAKIFDPFFTTKAPGKGTGLGLSVSHDIIVNKHKGEILVDSTVGQGTKFTIKLPIDGEHPDNNDELFESDAELSEVMC